MPPDGGSGGSILSGPNAAAFLQALQQLVQSTNAQAQVIKGNLGLAASGDLSGIYPGPITIVANAISTLKILNAAVTYQKIQAEAANSLLGNPTGVPATPSEVTLAAALAFAGTALDIASGGVTTAKLAAAAVTYAKIQNEGAASLIGNPTGGAATPSEVTLGATLAFVGQVLRTLAHTGDVTSAANSFATTVAAIGGVSVAPTGWTPALRFGGSTTGITYGTQLGNAIQLGKLTIASFAITLTSKGAQTGAATIAGLPATAGAVDGAVTISSHAAMATSNVFECAVSSGGTIIALGKGNAAASAALADTDFNNNTSIAGTATYIAA